MIVAEMQKKTKQIHNMVTAKVFCSIPEHIGINMWNLFSNPDNTWLGMDLVLPRFYLKMRMNTNTAIGCIS